MQEQRRGLNNCVCSPRRIFWYLFQHEPYLLRLFSSHLSIIQVNSWEYFIHGAMYSYQNQSLSPHPTLPRQKEKQRYIFFHYDMIIFYSWKKKIDVVSTSLIVSIQINTDSSSHLFCKIKSYYVIHIYLTYTRVCGMHACVCIYACIQHTQKENNYSISSTIFFLDYYSK